MPERATIDDDAKRMRKSPRSLREKLNHLPKVGDRFGRLWTFTAAQERALIEACVAALKVAWVDAILREIDGGGQT